MDAGGLFMVRLRKRAGVGDPETGWAPVPENFPGQDRSAARARLAAAIDELEVRFGFNRRLLEELGWIVRGENIWAHRAEQWPVSAWARDPRADRWRVVSLGIRALKRTTLGMETPSNHFLSRWGGELGGHRKLELDRNQLRNLLSDLDVPAAGLPVGPLALLGEGRVLGRGMVGARGLRHEIPGASAERLGLLLRKDGEGGTHGRVAGGQARAGEHPARKMN
jgi:hypothetical protein